MKLYLAVCLSLLALPGCGNGDVVIPTLDGGSVADGSRMVPDGGGGDGSVGPDGACTPNSMACAGKCGRIQSCGAVIDCGGCPQGQNCGGGGTPNVCGVGTCTASCTGQPCGGSDGCSGVCSQGSCGGGLHCVDGACTCDTISCPGCCLGNVCEPGSSSMACGRGGVLCEVCAVNASCTASGGCAGCMPSCAGQACGAPDGCGGTCNAGSCPVGQRCGNGSCTCDQSSCAGCCAGNTCEPGTTDSACGAGGSMCLSCPTGSTCGLGRCQSCGGNGEACCPGNGCNSPLTCTGGTCVAGPVWSACVPVTATCDDTCAAAGMACAQVCNGDLVELFSDGACQTLQEYYSEGIPSQISLVCGFTNPAGGGPGASMRCCCQ